MRYQFFLLLTLVVSFSTGLFAVSQVYRYFTQKQIVLGAWNNEAAEVSFGELAPTATSARVLGASTGEQYLAPRTYSTSYQGYIFDQYFAQNGSPLYGHGDEFVKACQKYGAPKDCLLLPAIAKVETNLCKTDISAKQYNCWGWGGSGSNRILFSSFPESIDTITRRLMIGYGTRFFNDANYGGLTYCGAHCVNWGKHVESEKRRLTAFFRAYGYEV